MRHILVMAKAPVPGEVKTRLCPPCTPAEAATIAEAALADTLAAVGACGAEDKVLALAGPPGPWLPPGFRVIPQRGATFAQRLINAWGDAGPVGVQIGMDTPQVTAADLDALLAGTPDAPSAVAMLGLATDGGWWTIGLAGADPERVFRGIPMSTPMTGRLQAARLRALGLRVLAAPTRRDIDTMADLAVVSAQMLSTSRTAMAARALAAVAVA